MTELKDMMGYCPTCGTRGRIRERRINGNDTCGNGHVYPSRTALTTSTPDLIEDDEEDAFVAESNDEVLDLIGK